MQIYCCICGEDAPNGFYRKIGDFTLLKCKGCGLVFLGDFPDDQKNFIHKAQKQLNNSSSQKVEYWSFPHLYQKYEDIFARYFSERLRRLQAFCPHIKSLFDIGCGYGFWLRYCQQQGIEEVEGLDLSEEAVVFAKSRLGQKVWCTSLEDFSFTRDYDCIVMCDILEHLSQPARQLLKIRSALKDKGILFIQVPNLLGFKLPPFHGFGLPYHIWQFKISTLNRLLRNNGFKVLRYWTGVMGVIGTYEKGGPNIGQRLMWFFARHLKVGNRLMMVAKKI